MKTTAGASWRTEIQPENSAMALASAVKLLQPAERRKRSKAEISAIWRSTKAARSLPHLRRSAANGMAS